MLLPLPLRRLGVVWIVVVSVVSAGVALGAAGDIHTIAGVGTGGFSGDGAAATSAEVYVPYGVAVDGDGNVFIADSFNHRVRRVDAVTGFISTVAGTGTEGFSGDGAAATSAELYSPWGVAVDGDGNVFIADFRNHRVRRVDAVTGFISTIAGTTAGFSGDGAAATSAELNYPSGVAVDGDGNVLIADTDNHRVRRVDAVTGFISTVAGTGSGGFSGDGAAATSAQLYNPRGVAVDGDGNVLIADTDNHRVRRVDVVTEFISTVAGTGSGGFSGDGGAATSAQLYNPRGVAVDGVDVLIADTFNNRVRLVEAADADGDGFADSIDNFPAVYSRCRLSQATIIGTAGIDTLNGTSGADVMMGFGGADAINGLGGDDLICAGNGADIISGGDGKDRIYGENGTDTIFGNEMSDRIYGGDGDDILRGNGGTRDRLFGGDGIDDLNGGTGTDDRCTLGEVYSACEVVF